MARYRLKIIDLDKQDFLEKLEARVKGYLFQLSQNFKKLEEKDDKIENLISEVMEIKDNLKIKENLRRKTAGKVGGLQKSLNRQKEKNKLLLKLSKSLEKQLDDKTKESEKTEKELEEIKRQLEFFKNHRKAYSMEEYRNYVERRKECEKRLKENNEGRTIKQ